LLDKAPIWVDERPVICALDSSDSCQRLDFGDFQFTDLGQRKRGNLRRRQGIDDGCGQSLNLRCSQF